MFCQECGLVLAPGPLDSRRARIRATVDHRTPLLQRLWRWIVRSRVRANRRQ